MMPESLPAIVPCRGGPFLIDREDLPRLQGFGWYVDGEGYVAAMAPRGIGRRRMVLLHRHLMGARPGELVDHRNRDTLDNRRANLRFASRAVNMANSNRGPMRGVRADIARGRWRAEIGAAGRTIYLGTFESPAEAIAARQAAELEHFGELCPR